VGISRARAARRAVRPLPTSAALNPSAFECIWVCVRGRARLCCQLRQADQRDLEIEVLRNDRLYGTYRFFERPAAAVDFAARLRGAFEGSGWRQRGIDAEEL